MRTPSYWGMAGRGPQWRRTSHGHPPCHDRTRRRFRDPFRRQGARPAPQRRAVDGAAIGHGNGGVLRGIQPNAQARVQSFSDAGLGNAGKLGRPILDLAGRGCLRAQPLPALHAGRLSPPSPSSPADAHAGRRRRQPGGDGVGPRLHRGLAHRPAALAPRVLAAADLVLPNTGPAARQSPTPLTTIRRLDHALGLPADPLPPGHAGLARILRPKHPRPPLTPALRRAPRGRRVRVPRGHAAGPGRHPRYAAPFIRHATFRHETPTRPGQPGDRT